MSTLKVNYIQANTTSEIDINSPLGTIPSLDVSGSATIGGNLNITGVSTFTGNSYVAGSLGVGTASPGTQLDVYGSDSHIRATESGTGIQWRSRIISRNIDSSVNAAAFMGIYNTSACVAAHNSTLNAWATLFVNTTNGISDGGNVILAGSGNVGIRFSSPAFPLDVNGGNTGSKTVRITSSGTDSALALNNTGSGGREYWIDSGSSGSGVGSGNFAIYDSTIGLTRWKIDSSGRVTMPYQPYFYARPTASGDGQTANPYTFPNVIHNVGNHFVTSGTGAYQRFVAPIDGVYCFQTSPGYKQTSIDWNAYVRINGTTYAEVGRFIGSPSSHSICTGSITLKLSANDYVDISNQGTAYHLNTTFNFFCGYLLG